MLQKSNVGVLFTPVAMERAAAAARLVNHQHLPSAARMRRRSVVTRQDYLHQHTTCKRRVRLCVHTIANLFLLPQTRD